MGNAEIADVLERAADLLSLPGQWCKRSAAKDANGCLTEPSGKDAVSWCVWGAFRKLTGNDFSDAFEYFARFVGGSTSPSDFGNGWNDAPERTQAEVVAKLREAAKAAREAAR